MDRSLSPKERLYVMLLLAARFMEVADKVEIFLGEHPIVVPVLALDAIHIECDEADDGNCVTGWGAPDNTISLSVIFASAFTRSLVERGVAKITLTRAGKDVHVATVIGGKSYGLSLTPLGQSSLIIRWNGGGEREVSVAPAAETDDGTIFVALHPFGDEGMMRRWKGTAFRLANKLVGWSLQGFPLYDVSLN